MKKRMLAMLLVIVMVFGMIPVIAGAETTAEPVITRVNMTLGGILGINFKVDAKGADMSACRVRVTVGEDTLSQVISQYEMDGGMYVYTAKLPVHRVPETLKIELLNGDTVVQTRTDWTVEAYLTDLLTANPGNEELADLAEALLNYGSYAAYYDAPEGEAPSVEAVEAVTREKLSTFKHNILTKGPAGLGAVVSLFLDDACDLRVKFNASAWEGNKLLVDGQEQPLNSVDDKVVYEILELLPQNWSKVYNIQVVNAQDEVIMEYEYCALSYGYAALGSKQELAPGLNGLIKAMYLYRNAVDAFINAGGDFIEGGIIDEDDGPVVDF